MIKKENVVELGIKFSKVVMEKYFPNTKTEDWFESGNGEVFNEFTFGEKESNKNVSHLITNVLFFGTRAIHPQFTMKLGKDWKGDYVTVCFGLEAWETNKELCKTIFNELIDYLKDNQYDWLITTPPVNEVCLPNQSFQVIPTGKNSALMVELFTKVGATMTIGTIHCKGSHYAIKDIDKLTFVSINSHFSITEELNGNKDVHLAQILLPIHI